MERSEISTTAIFGFLNVIKPKGLTSHDVVAKIRRITKIKQVGHGGTLDPLAEGVLPIAFNSACRLFRYLEDDKVYRASILLGRQTTTDDILGETIVESNIMPREHQIRTALKKFNGKILQSPPLYSAIHHNGKRLYQLARAGIAPAVVAQRQVIIHTIDLLSCEDNNIELRIHCSKGTYIRSIARDLGSALECGGCLSALVREQAGPFSLDQSRNVDSLLAISCAEQLNKMVINPIDVLTPNERLQYLEVNKEDAIRLSTGQSLSTHFVYDHTNPVFISFNRKLIAVCRVEHNNKLHPKVVLLNANEVS